MSPTSLKESLQERAEAHFLINAPKYQALLKIVPFVGTGTAAVQAVHAHRQSNHLRAEGKPEEAAAKEVETHLRLSQACATGTGWIMTAVGATAHAHSIPQLIANWAMLLGGMGVMAYGISKEYDPRLESTQRSILAEEIVLRRSTLRLEADYRVDRARHAGK